MADLMWGSCRIRQRTASENASVGEVSRGAERIERTGGTHHARFESSHVHEEATAVDAARAAVLRRHPSDVMLHVVRDMFDALAVAAPFRVPLAHDAQRNRHTLPRAPPLGERWASVRRVQRPAREQSRWLLGAKAQPPPLTPLVKPCSRVAAAGAAAVGDADSPERRSDGLSEHHPRALPAHRRHVRWAQHPWLVPHAPREVLFDHRRGFHRVPVVDGEEAAISVRINSLATEQSRFRRWCQAH